MARAQAFDADPLRKRHEAVMEQRASDFRKAIIEILDTQPSLKPRERERQLRAATERYALEFEWEIRERVTQATNITTDAKKLQKAWVQVYRNECGVEPDITAEKAQAYRGLGNLSKSHEERLQRAIESINQVQQKRSRKR